MPLAEHFAHPPSWGVYIYLYFFFGGIAGGAYALGTLLRWFGTTRDAVAARAAFYVAFPALAVCPLLLTIDLGQPLRFWHMLVDTSGGGFGIGFNLLSPMSVGAWALLLFGAFTFISFLEVLILDGRITHPAGRIVVGILRTPVGWLVNLLGSLLGLYICAYTGVLLSVSNQPIWSDAGWSLSALFVASSLSSGAAAMALANW
jgi:formate-dependent nitrite reductase membrane component NrfD